MAKGKAGNKYTNDKGLKTKKLARRNYYLLLNYFIQIINDD